MQLPTHFLLRDLVIYPFPWMTTTIGSSSLSRWEKGSSTKKWHKKYIKYNKFLCTLLIKENIIKNDIIILELLVVVVVLVVVASRQTHNQGKENFCAKTFNLNILRKVFFVLLSTFCYYFHRTVFTVMLCFETFCFFNEFLLEAGIVWKLFDHVVNESHNRKTLWEPISRIINKFCLKKNHKITMTIRI